MSWGRSGSREVVTMPLRIACVGGGPGGLLLATLVKRSLPEADVRLLERNRPDDTFGFGVVFSDATLDAIDAADPVLQQALREHGVHWDRIEVRLRGERLVCSGNGMAAVRRVTLLQLLQRSAVEAGVDLRFSAEVTDPAELDGFDLVVAADGANSSLRRRAEQAFGPTVETATAKFIWFGTTHAFEGLTFVHAKGPHGVFAAHAYPIGNGLSTFIVETDEDSWQRAGLDEFDVTQPPGPSDDKTRRYLEELFSDQIAGEPLLVNNSRWSNFRTLRTRRWSHGNVVLLGDAAHTAHFSVGSGTKMAMEDAVSLAAALVQSPDDVPTALERYEAERRPSVERIQGAARPSLSWWEHFGRSHDAMPPVQFAFHFFSRSISRRKLQRRDPDFVAQVDAWWQAEHGAAPLQTPLEVGPARFTGRRTAVVDGPALAAEGWPLPLVAPDGELAGAAARLTAPDDEEGLAPVSAQLRRAVAAGAAAVALEGGTALTRSLLAEEARLSCGVPAVVVADLDDDAATTLLLSGRGDLVAQPADAA
jgi:2-polyprenyl-6-methoxyphenol hydroxylase-like FAD-dependent oxidoreductase